MEQSNEADLQAKSIEDLGKMASDLQASVRSRFGLKYGRCSCLSDRTSTVLFDARFEAIPMVKLGKRQVNGDGFERLCIRHAVVVDAFSFSFCIAATGIQMVDQYQNIERRYRGVAIHVQAIDARFAVTASIVLRGCVQIVDHE